MYNLNILDNFLLSDFCIKYDFILNHSVNPIMLHEHKIIIYRIVIHITKSQGLKNENSHYVSEFENEKKLVCHVIHFFKYSIEVSY